MEIGPILTPEFGPKVSARTFPQLTNFGNSYLNQLKELGSDWYVNGLVFEKDTRLDHQKQKLMKKWVHRSDSMECTFVLELSVILGLISHNIYYSGFQGQPTNVVEFIKKWVFFLKHGDFCVGHRTRWSWQMWTATRWLDAVELRYFNGHMFLPQVWTGHQMAQWYLLIGLFYQE